MRAPVLRRGARGVTWSVPDMDSSLRARLAWRANGKLTAAAADRAVMARSATYLYAAGATLVLVSLALPQLPGTNKLGLLALLGVAYLVAGVLVAGFDRLPLWAFQALVALGTLIVTAAIYFSGEGSSAYVLFYLWVAVYAFYFFGRAQAFLQLGLVASAYAVVLLVREPSVPLVRWLITVGTLVVAGVLIQLLSERVQSLIARLADTTRIDALTGLLNRRAFEELVEVEVERARRSGRSLSVIVGDPDHFRDLNDRLGSHVGDIALERLARLLEEVKRRIDTAARIGGGDFALVLPESDEHGAYMVAERVRDAAKGAFAAGPVPLTMSLGVASYPAQAETADVLVRAAHRALYGAKELGRDRSVIYSADIAGFLSETAGSPGTQDELLLATVLSLAEALDIRDAGTARHSQTVGRYAEAMARELGLSRARVERVRLAGVLHDVGKIGVSDTILRKPGPLTEAEWVEMRTHPEIGARILGTASFGDVRDWVLAHHERPDGRGYPYAREDDVPLEAKILAVADAYEAMTADRIYRPAIGPDAARGELRRCAGTQFDKRVVEALLRVEQREPATAGAQAPGRGSGS